MRFARMLTLGVLSLAVPLSSSAQREHLLDLTSPPATNPGGDLLPVCGAGSSGRVRRVMPVRLTLRLDRTESRTGESFTYEVDIENTGASGLPLAWQRYEGPSFKAKAAEMLLALRLEVRGTDGKPYESIPFVIF